MSKENSFEEIKSGHLSLVTWQADPRVTRPQRRPSPAFIDFLCALSISFLPTRTDAPTPSIFDSVIDGDKGKTQTFGSFATFVRANYSSHIHCIT